MRGTCLALLKKYLSEREQFVEYKGVKSSLANIITVIPKGSILGPLLFIMCMSERRGNFVFISRLLGRCANQKFETFARIHHMAILIKKRK